MPDYYTLQRGQASRPIWLLRASDLDAWRSGMAPSVAAWVRESGFAAEGQRLLLLPGPDGALVGAAYGLGALGDDAHAPGEYLEVDAISVQVRRAALLFHRLTH